MHACRMENTMIKEYLKRGALSFAIASFSGLLINFIIDIIVNALGYKDFCSISPYFLALFPTTALAAYTNVLLYGLIGATFAVSTIVYEWDKIGFVIQSILYFLITAAVCLAITTILWQLQRHPAALISTLAGYAMTHVIMITIAYKNMKRDILEINKALET